jgi:hypothetical protein
MLVGSAISGRIGKALISLDGQSARALPNGVQPSPRGRLSSRCSARLSPRPPLRRRQSISSAVPLRSASRIESPRLSVLTSQSTSRDLPQPSPRRRTTHSRSDTGYPLSQLAHFAGLIVAHPHPPAYPALHAAHLTASRCVFWSHVLLRRLHP